MGKKTSVVPQMDYIDPVPFKRSHRPTKLSGDHNIKAFAALKAVYPDGLTTPEVCKQFGWPPTSSALSELRAMYLARRTETLREGHHVYVIHEDALDETDRHRKSAGQRAVVRAQKRRQRDHSVRAVGD